MTHATVEGKQVTIGDTVGFKSDVEQYGRIVAIERSPFGGVQLTLTNLGGFEGHYIGGQTTTKESADHCWVD